MKTSELSGAALDWAVAKAMGLDVYVGTFGPMFGRSHKWACVGVKKYNPSGHWAQGGPIIEREKITVDFRDFNQTWSSTFYPGGAADLIVGEGPTFLIAAMRCFVASKLGDEVEVPKELMK